MKYMEYKVGDTVKVVRGPWEIRAKEEGYEIIWHNDDDSVGQEGIVIDAHMTQNLENYSLHYPNGFKGKMAWFNEKDLDLV